MYVIFPSLEAADSVQETQWWLSKHAQLIWNLTSHLLIHTAGLHLSDLHHQNYLGIQLGSRRVGRMQTV